MQRKTIKDTDIVFYTFIKFAQTMQIKKQSVRKKIVQVAKQEFIDSSFKNTSMRTIAKNANVTLSNIYNYFKSKDEIFVEILNPLLLALEKLTETHNESHRITVDWFTIEAYQQRMLDDFLEIINNYRPELKLLLFSANGSSLENYTTILIEQHTELGIQYFKLMKQKYHYINDDISQFFIHTASSWWVTIISQIVLHDELTEKEIKHFIKNYITFGTAGWKTLMNIENPNRK